MTPPSTIQTVPPIRVLYVGLRHDYGDPSRGWSYEYLNFFETLSQMKNVKVEQFAFDEVMRKVGREEMNRRLIDTILENQPDLCFFVLFTDEIKKSTLKKLTESGKTMTVNWFCDDHWRFDSFSKFYAPHFHWTVTTDHAAVEKYHRWGVTNVVRSQWAFNHFSHVPRSTRNAFDVSFVGQTHSRRRSTIEELSRRRIHVDCWGKGWPNGRVSPDRMFEIISGSKINLNFSESSVNAGWKPMAKIFFNRRADSTYQINSLRTVVGALKSRLGRSSLQIKGRNFEIPGAGGFLLTSRVESLEEYFVFGKEIEVFESTRELEDKVEYYLAHERERETIRACGHERTLREHTYEARFNELFRRIGLSSR